MRASFDVVRRAPTLLWFPVISTACLALTAGYWILEGAWLYHVSGRSVFFGPLVIAGLYSLAFVGVFFSVALAGAAAEVLDGGEPSLSGGVHIGWNRLGGIAGWAAYSIFVAVVLGFVKSIKGLRWLGTAAEIAWSFATIFVVPLIALEGLDSASARQSSFQLAKENWRAESGGLGALRAALQASSGRCSRCCSTAPRRRTLRRERRLRRASTGQRPHTSATFAPSAER